MIPMRGARRDQQMRDQNLGPTCECGERGLTPVEADADRCEICDRDPESLLALRYARQRADKQ
jgi:hypothetical protein